MPSLADIVPAAESVSVRGVTFEVQGITIKCLGQLFMRFPEVRAMLEKGEMDASKLLGASDAAMNFVIADCLGLAGNEKEEAGVARLSLGEKATVLDAILRLTMPDGPGPFVKLVATLTEVGTKGEEVKLRAKK